MDWPVAPVASRALRGPDASTDTIAIQRVAAGDMGALGELYDRHAPGLLRFLRRSASLEDAEDILQGTFLRLAATAPRFDPQRGEARAWIFGIAAYVLRERRRAWSRLTRALTRLVAEDVSHSHSSRKDSVSAPVEVAKALESLSDAKREAFVLVELEGFTCEEAAEILGVPVGTVWTRLHHARKQLRESLDGEVAR